MKIQPIILDEKTSANDAMNNGLISKIYRQLIQIIKQKGFRSMKDGETMPCMPYV